MRIALRGALLSLVVLAGIFSPVPAAELSVDEVAAKVDALLAEETGTEKAVLTDDDTFLRRASLDTMGRNPTAVEIEAFALDGASDRRRRVVERLLASEDYGRNWARYWRDVILSRRLEERALIASDPLEVYLTNALNANRPWNEIAREFITATGDVRQNGSTALIFAQGGEAVETAAEVSRIFLGVQIQCAQCHDHKTDRWRREQFHELAAFFPRMRLQAVQNPLLRSFEIVSFDRPRAARPNKQGKGSSEHYMSDLEDPQARGTLMTPTFFVSAAKAELGMTDAARRGQLAEWLTADDNPWFARAVVNRLWAELVGQGFYEPIDDLGPDRDATAPRTLAYLAEQFLAHGHDVKWLLRAIMATDAYGRESRARSGASAQSFAANRPQPLRADTLFDALATALEMETPPAVRGPKPGMYFAGPRHRFGLAFGYDPSESRDEIAATIPQALFLMNSPQLKRALNARRPASLLGRLLREVPDDKRLVADLFLRCLAREPNEKEIDACLDYVKQLHNRAQAFEDIAWSLVNSTEFRHRK